VRASFSDWAERQADRLFVLPAVVVILAFSIFPLLLSAYLSVSRFKLGAGGYEIRFIGWLNYRKLLFGSEQFHFVGRFASVPLWCWAGLALLAWWIGRALLQYLRSGRVSVLGFVGRLISAVTILGIALLFATTLGQGGQLGSAGVTVLYVVVGVAIQFGIGLGLALLCAQRIHGRAFFRLVFFLPLMVTPVGIAYAFRMLADMTQGPLSPIWFGLGFGEFSWASSGWSARIVVMVGDAWQWIPFIFIVMLAAIESQSKEQLEAASIDGASFWQRFRDITWPEIAPVAATVVLIRMIEAFKIIDLPNVLTNGGPGIASESMTLHAYSTWRALDIGGSAAIAYMLLFIVTFFCTAFVNLVRTRPTKAAGAQR
jgi:multiple sugar transport system permease protein